MLSLRFDKNPNKFTANLCVDDKWQEEQYGLNQNQIDNIVKSSTIPYLYKFITAIQPVFVLSESVGDRLNYRGRAFTRTTDEKALFFKYYDCYPYANNERYYGYGILSATDGGIGYTGTTAWWDEPSYRGGFRTPKGNTVYLQVLSGLFEDNGISPVVATVNGTDYIIEEATFSIVLPGGYETDMDFFILSMCDFYLF